MFKIAICDDEQALIDELKNNLKRYADETEKTFCFFEFHDGTELIENYQPDFDLIFMDIKMERLNGLKTAEEIRKTDSTVGLFFLTSLSRYVWKGYEYGALNYLLKPIKYGRLKMELDRFFSCYQVGEELYISFSNDIGKFKVLYKDLRYAETAKRNVLLQVILNLVSYDSLNSNLLVSTDPEKENAVGEVLSQMVDERMELGMQTLADRKIADAHTVNTLFGAISGLAIFIMTFSVLSMMNTLITNIVTRKQELAMLESIGMAKDQIRKMLLGESLFLVLMTVGTTMTIGTLCGYVLSKMLYNRGGFLYGV